MYKPGSSYLIRYNVAGPPLYHARIVIGVAPGHEDQLFSITPDLDTYVEHIRPSGDVHSTMPLEFFGSRPPGIAENAIYAFDDVPSDAVLLRAVHDFESQFGLALSGRSIQLRLGPDRAGHSLESACLASPPYRKTFHWSSYRSVSDFT